MMKQPLKLHPFITYNPSTQSIQIHKNISDHHNNNVDNAKILNNKKVSYISVIQVKSKDFKVLANIQNINVTLYQNQQQNNHGIYISDQIQSQQNQKSIKYIILQTNQQKIPQKFQDFFASILLSISNVCIFDISSKYLRSSNCKSIQENNNKYYYVMMNTKGNLQAGELYKVNMQNYMSKLQISNKIGNTNHRQLIKQLVSNIKYNYCMQNIQSILKQIIQPRFLWKNYTNFEEIQYNFISSLKLQVYLQENSKEYDKFMNKKQKLSIKQMQGLQNIINSYNSYEFSTTQYIQILNYVKKSLKSKYRIINKSYTDKFLINMKNQYFTQVSSFQELQIKKQLSERILQQYGISKNNLKLLYGEIQQKLNTKQKQRVNQIILTKQSKIFELESKLYKTEQILKKTSQMLEIYQDKNMDFKKLNEKYQQKYQQLEKQREQNVRTKQYIDNLHLQLKKKEQTQENLHKYIIQILQQKNIQQNAKNNLQSQMKDKQIKISQLMTKIDKLQEKIKYYQYIENKYYKAEQNTKSAKDQMERYKNLLQNLEKHFQSFKKVQIQKFNYILKKNYERFNKQISQSQHKTQIIKNHQCKINKLYADLQQQKLRLKFCQGQMIKILQNKQNRLHLDHHTEPEKLERKSLNKSISQVQIQQRSRVKINEKHVKYSQGKLNIV